jgi:hypothetical protein
MKDEPTPSKGGAPSGNANAQRGASPATSKLVCRCTPADKSAWVKATHASADHTKLSEWVIATLNAAAKKELRNASKCPTCQGSGTVLEPATNVFGPCPKCQ